jgi:hypothetical protein
VPNGECKSRFNGFLHNVVQRILSVKSLHRLKRVMNFNYLIMDEINSIQAKCFYTPKEVLNTLIAVLDNPKFNEKALANHLLILAVSFSKQHLFCQTQGASKFCLDLYHLCQNHISD